MKPLNYLLAITLTSAFLVSCQSIDGPSEAVTNMNAKEYVDVNVNFSGLDITTTPITSKASDKSASDASVKRINLAVYDSNGTLIKDTIQDADADATNFGQSITLRLPVGSYKFVAVAHTVAATTDAAAAINSATEVSYGTQTKRDPLYSTVQDVTLSGNTTQAVTIDFGTRRNAKLIVKITDTTPSDVQKMQLIVSPTASDYTDLKFNPSTGFAASTWRYSSLIDKTESSVTTFTNKNLTLTFLLTGTTQTADVTINALASDNTVLYTRTLSNVSFQQGHVTKATGTFFSPEATSSFVFDTTVTTDEISLD